MQLAYHLRGIKCIAGENGNSYRQPGKYRWRRGGWLYGAAAMQRVCNLALRRLA